MERYEAVDVELISPNPLNPRRRFDGPAFDELLASIREKGVIQPIVVRPIGNGNSYPMYEIVAGERRWRASKEALKDNGDRRYIPAIVRELDDDAAFEIMTIENLQREDLTELEEARSFQTYLDRKGMDALEDLALKVGTTPAYIRRRTSVLGLPEAALNLWEEGKLKFGHLALLARLGDPDRIDHYLRDLTDDRRWIPTVEDLRRRIENDAPPLGKAVFDKKKTGCKTCGQNSTVQRQLFGSDDAIEKARCLNPKCYKQHVNNHLLATWKEGTGSEHKTNGFRFDDAVPWEQRGYFHQAKLPKACKECTDFVSLVDITGQVRNERICIGPKYCFNKTTRSGRSRDAGAGATSSIGHRARQLALEFRKKFILEEIPRKMPADNSATADYTGRLALAARVIADFSEKEEFCTRHGIETSGHYVEDGPIMRHILTTLKPVQVVAELQYFALIDLPKLGQEALLEASKAAGIDLAAEWQLTEEFLKRKRKAELIALGEELGTWADPAVQEYITMAVKEKSGDPKYLKKAALIQCFMGDHYDRRGKVPKEIYQVEGE